VGREGWWGEAAPGGELPRGKEKSSAMIKGEGTPISNNSPFFAGNSRRQARNTDVHDEIKTSSLMLRGENKEVEEKHTGPLRKMG